MEDGEESITMKIVVLHNKCTVPKRGNNRHAKICIQNKASYPTSAYPAPWDNCPREP